MPQASRKKFDPNSPEVRAFRREVREATFTREGMMVAFPTCFPGMTVPIVHDESRITALDATPEGTIVGATSGYRTHLFVAEFHGLTGAVFDLGVVSGATECVAVCCVGGQIVAFVNGTAGGHAVLVPLSRLSEDLVQEWGFRRPTFDDLGECVAGEPVVHAVAEPSGSVVGVSSRHVFSLDPKSRAFRVLGEAPAGGRIAVTPEGNVVGRDGERALWHFSPKESAFRRGAFTLPGGAWTHALHWTRRPKAGPLITADGAGHFLPFDEARGFGEALGQAILTPVGPMAATFDGRVFGFCGTEISRLFCLDPRRRTVTTLGGAASVIEHRRYGYVFGDAVTGRDGEIVFGENDNGGHLWLYFPRIQSQAGE